MTSWLDERIQAIRTCLESGFAEASLTLLYSATDTLAFLAAPATTQYCRKSDFIVWCDQYIVPCLPEASGATGTDLYGARCGVLHTSSAASSLGQKGEAREIWYQFKSRTGVNMMTNTPQPALLLEVEMLVSAFEKASQMFLAYLGGDRSQLAIAEQRAKQFFNWGLLRERPAIPLKSDLAEAQKLG